MRVSSLRGDIIRFSLVLAVAAGSLLPATGSAQSRASAPDLRSLVTQIYIHGIPYELAKSQGPGAVPELVAMLADPALDEYRSNIVAVLGCIGDPSAIEPLIGFVRGLDGEISVHTFRAVLTTFQSLGHLAQSGDERALSFLVDWSDDSHWATERVGFSYAVYRDERLGEVLGRLAVQGLGISGRPEAYRRLNELATGNLREDWYDNVGEALELNGRVAVEGPRSVFSEVGK